MTTRSPPTSGEGVKWEDLFHGGIYHEGREDGFPALFKKITKKQIEKQIFSTESKEQP